MDFASRDLYRRAIEQMARGSKHTELDIARAALAAGDVRDAEHGDADRRRDPGYHLIGPGRRAFETTLGYRAPRWNAWRRSRLSKARDYIGAILMIAVMVILVPLTVLESWGVREPWLILWPCWDSCHRSTPPSRS